MKTKSFVPGVSVAEIGARLTRVGAAFPDARVEFTGPGFAVLHGVPPPPDCDGRFVELNPHGVWVIRDTGFAWATDLTADEPRDRKGRWFARYHI